MDELWDDVRKAMRKETRAQIKALNRNLLMWQRQMATARECEVEELQAKICQARETVVELERDF